MVLHWVLGRAHLPEAFDVPASEETVKGEERQCDARRLGQAPPASGENERRHFPLSCDVRSAGVEALHASSALHSGCCSRCCSTDEDRHPGVSAKGTQERGAWRLDPSLLTRGPVGAASQRPWVQGCLERA